MEDKYYTPTIDEFYVGFEYEIQLSFKIKSGDTIEKDGVIYIAPDTVRWEWQKRTIHDSYDFEFATDYYTFNGGKDLNERLRVKYLDKEDIESLGFKTAVHDASIIIPGDITIYGQLVDKDVYIDYIPETHWVKLHSIDYDFFNGIIKNKSEMLRILKMIGVK